MAEFSCISDFLSTEIKVNLELKGVIVTIAMKEERLSLEIQSCCQRLKKYFIYYLNMATTPFGIVLLGMTPAPLLCLKVSRAE